MKYISYQRVSTNKQGVSGLGLEAQQAAVADFAASGEIIASYTEVETGTNKRERPQLAAAIDHCKQADAVLLIAKLDRLARNVAFVANLMESGVEFVAADQPQATRFTIHILAAVAENEAQMISERTKAALAAAKARGVTLGSPQNLTEEARRKGPQAMKAKAKRAYAHIIDSMKSLRESGKTLQAIADLLNTTGERTQRGKLWSSVAVMRVLNRC